MRYYIIVYSYTHDCKNVGDLPSWLQEEEDQGIRKGIRTGSHEDNRVSFVDVDQYGFPNDTTTQQKLVDSLVDKGQVERVCIFRYYECVFVAGVDFKTQNVFSVSYSSADPSYEPMWRDIRTAEDCSELARRLEYWMQHYAIDPVRRIKHRAVNLFTPLDTDCQHLLERWSQRRYDEARRHLEDMQKDWQGQPPYSNSPLSKLARLWYLLVGDNMSWPYEVKELRFWVNLSIDDVNKAVSLPEGGEGKERKGLCLRQWLKKVGKDQGTVWENMLATAGLKRSNQRFEPNADAGIYRFVVELQKRVIEGNLPDLQPDTRMQGFKNCDTVEANFKQFHQWMRALNEGFETLVEEVGGVYR